MSKLIAVFGGALLLGAGIATVQLVGSSEPAGATGTTLGTTTAATTASGVTTSAVDVSGPCDEAEHRNDPRCTGIAIDDDRGGDDRSGRGRGDDDDHDDDRSGSNRGRG